MTVQYSPGGRVDRFLTPSRTYATRTFFSGFSLAFHIISAIMLGVSPVISDPVPADEVYHIMYIICLAIVCLSIVAVAQQTYATGLASWRFKGRRGH